MNSYDLHKMFENMETKDIQVLMSMSIIYLIKVRKLELKNIIKDIKNVCKRVGV